MASAPEPAQARRPVIGICSRPSDDGSQIWIASGYSQKVCAAGGLPLALPFDPAAPTMAREVVGLLDGLLLTGGGDICPESFDGHVYDEGCKAELMLCCRQRDDFERKLAEAAWDADIPTLGVCRGMQLINVSRGGSMVRDVSEQRGVCTNDNMHLAPPFNAPCHRVTIDADSRLAGALGKTEFPVNSIHHQAVSDPGRGVRFVGFAGDGTPEALECPEKSFFVGVQWHPEILGTNPELFDAFVGAAAAYASRSSK